MKKGKKRKISKPKSLLSILIPGATVFISSFCIMVLELVAARLIARHLGSSLYTWTAVIGVVLAGITLGYYLGGRIADRFRAKRTLSVLFAVCSAASVLAVLLNNLVIQWMWLWRLSWPGHIFMHASIVFLLPSILLGAVSPVVAKMALAQGLPTGRTVGDIYACGAAGSIAGTFAAGYWLIAAMGSTLIIWMVGAVLLVLALCYRVQSRVLRVWLLLFLCALAVGIGPWDWAKEAGDALTLREKTDPRALYTDESRYFHIAVRRVSESPDRRVFMQDKLRHSEIIMGRITDLQYEYAQVYAAITRRLSAGKDKLSVLVIGGGGYVFPRYIEALWPGSQVDVVEIDPAVTEAAIKAFGLERGTSIRTFNMDARNYVDDLFQQQHRGRSITQYDFIYEDAINDYSVPFQLTTREFNEKIAGLLPHDGVYMANLIDVYDSGLFLGSYVNTLKQTFSNVYVIATNAQIHSRRNTFVVVAANRELDLDNLAKDYTQTYLDLWHLSEEEIAQLTHRTGVVILTDDHAPVENLLAPVVLRSSSDLLAEKYIALASRLAQEDRLDEIIEKCESALRNNPAAAGVAYNEMGALLARGGRLSEAIECFRRALKALDQAKIKEETATIHSNLGKLLRQTGQKRAAREQLEKAAQLFWEKLELYPDSAVTWYRLGNALATAGNPKAASEAYTKAVALNPGDPAMRAKLALSLEFQGRIDEAMSVLQNGLRLAIRREQVDAVEKLEKYIDRFKRRKSDKK